jgi:serine/threonine protein kinase
MFCYSTCCVVLLLLLLQVSHMAPELLRFGKMSPAVDVFSFGIMSESPAHRTGPSEQHSHALVCA